MVDIPADHLEEIKKMTSGGLAARKHCLKAILWDFYAGLNRGRNASTFRGTAEETELAAIYDEEERRRMALPSDKAYEE